MSKITVAYQPGIPDKDLAILESKEEAIATGISKLSFRWLFVLDSQNRYYYRLTEYSDPKACMMQVTISEVASADAQQFMVWAGDPKKACHDPQ